MTKHMNGSQSILSLASTGSQCGNSYNTHKRLSLHSPSANCKTPARSSLSSTKTGFEIPIDKSSDLVNIMNGFITHNRKNSTKDSNSSVILDSSNFRSINYPQRSPVFPKNGTPTIQKDVGCKTIKSSAVNNGRVGGIAAKPKDLYVPQGNIFKDYAKRPHKLVLNKENVNSRSQSDILMDITADHINTKKVSKAGQSSSNTSRILNDIETETRDMLKEMSYIQIQPNEVSQFPEQKTTHRQGSDIPSYQTNDQDDELRVTKKGFSTLSSNPVTERRRLSQSDVQNQIMMIQQKQKEKEQRLIEQFNKLKETAQNALLTNKDLSHTQTINTGLYEKRMERFEHIIESLLEKQDKSKKETMQQVVSLRTSPRNCKSILEGQMSSITAKSKSPQSKVITVTSNSQRSKLGPVTTQHQNETHFSDLSSNMKVSVSSHCHIHSNMQKSKKAQQANRPSEETKLTQADNGKQKKEMVQSLLEKTLPKGQYRPSFQKNPSINQSSSNKSCQDNLLNQQQKDIKGFLETIHTIEESMQCNSTQKKQDLTSLRDKLSTYRDNIRQEVDTSRSQKEPVVENHQSQILKALETLIKKMDFQLSLQMENSLGRNDTNVGSCKRAKNNQHIDTTIKLNETMTMERSNLPLQQQIEQQTVQECSDTIDATNQSLYQSSRKAHLKNCNKSGYQVKHSKYGKYELEEQIMNGALDTNEEQAQGSNTSWLNEIKHIKTLLGSMAENQKTPSTPTLQFQEKLQRPKDQQQCLIM